MRFTLTTTLSAYPSNRLREWERGSCGVGEAAQTIVCIMWGVPRIRGTLLGFSLISSIDSIVYWGLH